MCTVDFVHSVAGWQGSWIHDCQNSALLSLVRGWCVQSSTEVGSKPVFSETNACLVPSSLKAKGILHLFLLIPYFSVFVRSSALTSNTIPPRSTWEEYSCSWLISSTTLSPYTELQSRQVTEERLVNNEKIANLGLHVCKKGVGECTTLLCIINKRLSQVLTAALTCLHYKSWLTSSVCLTFWGVLKYLSCCDFEDEPQEG